MTPERAFTIFVGYANHEDLKAGVLARGEHLVTVLAPWLSEAKLIAAQMVMTTHPGDMATHTETPDERKRRVEAQARN